MMIARKWDRLEKFCEEHGYNIFNAMAEDDRGEGIIDDIRDLRRYLLLIEAEAAARGIACASAGHRDNLIETAEATERKKVVVVGGPGTRLDSGEVHQYDRELDHLSPPPGPSRRQGHDNAVGMDGVLG
jgi:hypothetical protein